MTQTTLTNIDREVANCGKPIHYFDKKSGRMRVTNRRCKRYSRCPRCAAWKKQQTERELKEFVGKARFIIVSKSDEKNTARNITSEYRRVAISDTHTAFIVNTNDENFGGVLNREDLKMFVDNCIPQNGRRMSGKLGIRPTITEEEQETTWEQIERDTLDPELEILFREFRVDFDTGLEDAPENAEALEAIVQAEVELPYSPTTEGELQEALYVMEMKTREVCERYQMSFNFLDVKKDYVRMSEVAWEWLPMKE